MGDAGGRQHANARVLVVDDEPAVQALVAETLRAEGHLVSVAASGAEALRRAVAEHPEVVVLDVRLPDGSGLDVCSALRADSRTAGTGIILLTALAEPADCLAGFDAGADDFVAKPFDVVELAARVEASLRRATHLRGISPLTGLPGNTDIVRELDRLLAVPEPDIAVLHADLDGFKAFNDRYGFVRGDEAIRATGEAIVAVVCGGAGPPRFVGHVGGDDFVAIVPAAGVDGVCAAIIDRVEVALAALYDPPDRERGWLDVQARTGEVVRVPLLGISIGVASTRVRPLASAVEASAVAAEVKMLAKAELGSAYRIDRRRR